MKELMQCRPLYQYHGALQNLSSTGSFEICFQQFFSNHSSGIQQWIVFQNAIDDSVAILGFTACGENYIQGHSSA